MGNFGDAAKLAVDLLQSGNASTPELAWESAARQVFFHSASSQKKGCPRNAFLGLCESGNVKGISAGNYTKSIKNKNYAIQALEEIKINKDLVLDKQKLWKIVTRGDGIAHNGQMDIIIKLFESGYIKN